MPTDTPDTEEPWTDAPMVSGLGFETADAQHLVSALDRLTEQLRIANVIAYTNGGGYGPNYSTREEIEAAIWRGEPR